MSPLQALLGFEAFIYASIIAIVSYVAVNVPIPSKKVFEFLGILYALAIVNLWAVVLLVVVNIFWNVERAAWLMPMGDWIVSIDGWLVLIIVIFSGLLLTWAIIRLARLVTEILLYRIVTENMKG